MIDDKERYGRFEEDWTPVSNAEGQEVLVTAAVREPFDSWRA